MCEVYLSLGLEDQSLTMSEQFRTTRPVFIIILKINKKIINSDNFTNNDTN